MKAKRHRKALDKGVFRVFFSTGATRNERRMWKICMRMRQTCSWSTFTTTWMCNTSPRALSSSSNLRSNRSNCCGFNADPTILRNQPSSPNLLSRSRASWKHSCRSLSGCWASFQRTLLFSKVCSMGKRAWTRLEISMALSLLALASLGKLYEQLGGFHKSPNAGLHHRAGAADTVAAIGKQKWRVSPPLTASRRMLSKQAQATANSQQTAIWMLLVAAGWLWR